MIFRGGILLILLSFVPWLLIPFVPWWVEGALVRSQVMGGLVVGAELLFWPGLLLAGKESWTTVKTQGWRRVLPELLRRLRSGK